MLVTPPSAGGQPPVHTAFVAGAPISYPAGRGLGICTVIYTNAAQAFFRGCQQRCAACSETFPKVDTFWSCQAIPPSSTNSPKLYLPPSPCPNWHPQHFALISTGTFLCWPGRVNSANSTKLEYLLSQAVHWYSIVSSSPFHLQNVSFQALFHHDTNVYGHFSLVYNSQSSKQQRIMLEWTLVLEEAFAGSV